MSQKSPESLKSTLLEPGYALGGWLPLAVSKDGRSPSRELMVWGLGEHSQGISAVDQDKAWMHQALITAMAGVGLPSPNPNVGCVLVKDGQELARGGTAPFGGLHGETQALARCPNPEALKGATAYVTLEPCSHFGKQPPCTQALLDAGIARCVFATLDPHPLVAGQGAKMLQAAGISLLSGPLRRESLAWNLPFFFEVLMSRPLIVGKWAQTLNGQMADQGGGSQWISGPISRRYVHWLRQKYDAIMVGAGTVLADGPDLTVRDSWGPMRHPLKIVFDPSGRLSQVGYEQLPEKVRQRTFAKGTKLVLVSSSAQKARKWAENIPADVYYVAVKSRDEAFDALLDAIKDQEFLKWYGRGLQSIFVEGGPALHNHLLSRNAYDAFHVFIAPSFISADQNRIGYFGAGRKYPGFTDIATMTRYSLIQSASLGNDVLMEFMPEGHYKRIFGGE